MISARVTLLLTRIRSQQVHRTLATGCDLKDLGSDCRDQRFSRKTLARRRRIKLLSVRLPSFQKSHSLFRSMARLGAVAILTAHKALSQTEPNAAGRVVEIPEFGSNPGQLKMFVYTPIKPLRPNGPLIVVLHGCGQQAGSFATDAGWLALANHFGIPLLLPEQMLQNNRGRCFNWYRPGDNRRGNGEAMSIRQMVRVAVKSFSCSQRQVFVVGLSAGGALAATLLAVYPAVFNAGAVVAGMPVGSASNITSALLRMHRANPLATRSTLVAAVRSQQSSSRSRKWPRISVWHGGQDRTIDPANGEALAASGANYMATLGLQISTTYQYLVCDGASGGRPKSLPSKFGPFP
jgi:poly(hydroxyalkanoate) depolymerase family esterase